MNVSILSKPGKLTDIFAGDASNIKKETIVKTITNEIESIFFLVLVVSRMIRTPNKKSDKKQNNEKVDIKDKIIINILLLFFENVSFGTKGSRMLNCP